MASRCLPGDDLEEYPWDPVSPKHRELCPETADLSIAPNLAGWDLMAPRFKGHRKNSLPTTGVMLSEIFTSEMNPFGGFTSDMSGRNSPNEILLESMQSLKGKSKFHSQDVSQDVPYFAYTSKALDTGPDQVSSFSAPDKKPYIYEVTGCKHPRFGDKGGLVRHKREVHTSMMYHCPIVSVPSLLPNTIRVNIVLQHVTMPDLDEYYWEPVSPKHRKRCPETADSPIAPNLAVWDLMAPQFKGHRKNPCEYCDVSASLPTTGATLSEIFTSEKGADVTAETKDGWTALHAVALYGHEAVIQLLLEKGASIAAEIDMSRQNSPNEILLGSMQSLKGKSKFHSQDVSQDVPYFACPSEVPGTGPDQVSPFSAPDKKPYIYVVTGCKHPRFSDKGGLDRHKREVHTLMIYYSPLLQYNLFEHQRRCHGQSSNRALIMIQTSQEGTHFYYGASEEGQCGGEAGSSLGTTVTGDEASSSGGKLQERLKILEELRTEIESDISARTGVLSLIEEGLSSGTTTPGEGSSLETTASGAVTNLTGEDKFCFEQFQSSSTDNDCLKSETRSSCWEEDTNETESTIDDGEGPGTFDALADISTHYHDEYSLALVKPVLTYAKRQLVDHIMEEFWILFNQGWVRNVRKCTGSTSVSGRESSSSSGPNSPDNQGSQKSQKSGKRRRDDEPNGDPDDRGRVPERSKEGSKDLDRRRLKFACPYRKHNSRKYCIQSIWRSCALTPQDTVARVKGHLYRHHRIFQCQRCKTLFDKSEEVDEHLQAAKGCDLSLAEEAEGITANIEKRLRSRKKTSKDQTEEERWVEMYRLIFPGDLVPSPYFEPILEDVDQPRETELLLFEEYSRQELPQMFRDSIETLVSEGTQPLERQLLGQLTTIIQECQDRIFSNYLRQMPRSSPSSAVIGEQTISGTIIEAPGHEGITSNELSHFFQRPPPPQMDVVGLSSSTASSSSHRYNNSTSIGYLSDTSTLPSSQDLPEYTSIHHSIGSSGAAEPEFAATLPVILYTHSHRSDNAPFQDGGEDSTWVSSDNLPGVSPFESNFNSHWWTSENSFGQLNF